MIFVSSWFSTSFDFDIILETEPTPLLFRLVLVYNPDTEYKNNVNWGGIYHKWVVS